MSENRKARRAQAAKQGKTPANGTTPANSMQPKGALMVCMATYDGKNDAALTEALMKEVPLLLTDRWIVGFARLEHNAIIASARNLLCDRFLRDWWPWSDGEKRPYTDMLFIDADVTFEQGAIQRILQHDVDVVFGCPPMKVDGEESWPCEFERDEGGYATPDPRTGLLAMTYGPAGFLRIRRQALQKLSDEGLAPEVVDKNCYGTELGRYRAFFHVDHVGARYIGEDVYFYERFRKTGGTVWMDPTLGFEHSGTKRWKGNVGAFLVSQYEKELQEAESEKLPEQAPEGSQNAAGAAK